MIICTQRWGKAAHAGNKCVFLVKGGSESKGTFEYWTRAGYNILTDPPFVSHNPRAAHAGSTTRPSTRLETARWNVRATTSQR